MARLQIDDLVIGRTSGGLAMLAGAVAGVYAAADDSVAVDQVAAWQIAHGTLSTVYAGPTGTGQVPNPQTVDSYGRFTGWVEAGADYDVVISTPSGAVAFRRLSLTLTAGGGTSGPAGGVLAGTFPDPGFAQDMATQAELDAAISGVGGNGSLVINVQAGPYNAKGDGTTDDQPAIQAAIDACGAAGGGIVYIPPGVYKLIALTYQSAGWGAHLVVSDDNVRVVGAGRGATTLKSTVSGASTVLDFLGYARNTAPANWATVRFPATTLRPFVDTDVYAKGDRTLAFKTAGDATTLNNAAANSAGVKTVLVATGQIDTVAAASRGNQPDGCVRDVLSFDTANNKVTLKTGLPKPMQREFFADATSNLVSTLTASSYPAPFGLYDITNTSIRDVGCSDMTIITGATTRPAVAYHSIVGFSMERMRLKGATADALGVHVGQEFTNAVFRDIECEISGGTVGQRYWGWAMCSDRILCENHTHVNLTDVAQSLFNEGVADVVMRRIRQISAKGAAGNDASFGAGTRSYDMVVEDLLIVNGGVSNALTILEAEPSPYYAGGGRLVRPKLIGSIPVPGYVRANWQVIDAAVEANGSLKFYGPPDTPTSSGVPSQNSTRMDMPGGKRKARLKASTPGGKVWLGRIPIQAWIEPPVVDVLTAFDSSATISIGAVDPATGTDFANLIVNGQDVTTIGRKVCTLASNHSQQSSAVELDLYCNIKTGTPTVGELVVKLEWEPSVRGV